MAADDYFATGFNEARLLFQAACRRARVETRGFGATHGMFGGPGGALVEVARLGDAGARSLVVLCAAGRLADALCCSGVEVGWLSEYAQAKLPRDTALILVNNGAAPASGGEPPPRARQVPKWDSELLAKVERRYAEYARERGIDHTGAPLAPESADAGDVPGFATDVLDGVAGELAPARDGRMLFLEFAVGLGPYGEAEMFPCHAPRSTAAQRARTWFGLPAPAEDDAESARQPDHLVAGVIRRFAGTEITVLRVAFGTYSVKSVLDMLSAARADAPKPDVRRLIFPESADWKQAVWRGAAGAVQRALGAVQRG